MSNQTLYHQDLFDWLNENLESVRSGDIPKAHAVIADPPYFLGSITKRFGKKNSSPAKYGKDGSFNRLSKGFMGKTWDGFENVWEYQAWVTAWAEMLLDFVHPGAVLAMFGGTRTYHRLVSGLEDAGWEIFDSVLAWNYANGFPKAADIGKLIDRKAGAERKIIGKDIHSANRSKTILRGGEYKGGFTTIPEGERYITEPSTDEAKIWNGYKTTLKPAYEPIVLARAPRGNYGYADLATQFGTGALNIDGGRVEYRGEVDPRTFGGSWKTDKAANNVYEGGYAGENQEVSSLGRYPANFALICDCENDQHEDGCPIRVLDQQSGNLPPGGNLSGKEPGEPMTHVYNGNLGRKEWIGYQDRCGASRFYYQVKSPSWEREVGLYEMEETVVGDGRKKSIDNAYQRGETKRRNTHPTVKPIRLIEWLAKLLLPPELDIPRRILIPFAGSGSEMIGCQLAGWDEIIGIEREEEYCQINEARRKWWSGFSSYDEAEKYYKISSKQNTDTNDEEIKKPKYKQLSMF